MSIHTKRIKDIYSLQFHPRVNYFNFIHFHSKEIIQICYIETICFPFICTLTYEGKMKYDTGSNLSLQLLHVLYNLLQAGIISNNVF